MSCGVSKITSNCHTIRWPLPRRPHGWSTRSRGAVRRRRVVSPRCAARRHRSHARLRNGACSARRSQLCDAQDRARRSEACLAPCMERPLVPPVDIWPRPEPCDAQRDMDAAVRATWVAGSVVHPRRACRDAAAGDPAHHRLLRARGGSPRAMCVCAARLCPARARADRGVGGRYLDGRRRLSRRRVVPRDGAPSRSMWRGGRHAPVLRVRRRSVPASVAAAVESAARPPVRPPTPPSSLVASLVAAAPTAVAAKCAAVQATTPVPSSASVATAASPAPPAAAARAAPPSSAAAAISLLAAPSSGSPSAAAPARSPRPSLVPSVVLAASVALAASPAAAASAQRCTGGFHSGGVGGSSWWRA